MNRNEGEMYRPCKEGREYNLYSTTPNMTKYTPNYLHSSSSPSFHSITPFPTTVLIHNQPLGINAIAMSIGQNSISKKAICNKHVYNFQKNIYINLSITFANLCTELTGTTSGFNFLLSV